MLGLHAFRTKSTRVSSGVVVVSNLIPLLMLKKTIGRVHIISL